MMLWVQALCLGVLVAGATAAAGSAAPGKADKPHRWKPVADEIFLQETVTRIPTAKPATAALCTGGTAYAVVDGALKAAEGAALKDVAGAPAGITRLCALDGALWAAAVDGAYRLQGKAWQRVGQGAFVDFCLHDGAVLAATRDELFRFDGARLVSATPAGGYLSDDITLVMDDFSQVIADPVQIGPISRIASFAGVIYLLRSGSPALIEGKTLIRSVADWGSLPADARDMLATGSSVTFATEKGLGILRGMSLTQVRGADGLPVEDATCLAEGFADDLWIGTTRGAIRRVGREFHYFGAGNWLPAERVNGISADGDRVLIATDGGVAVITYEPYTLAKKAAHYERELDAWGFKRLGFVNSLGWGGEADGWIRGISDNDGGNAATYLAAMCYKVAVTGDEKARQAAADTFDALVWLGDITGKPGFIARSVWSVAGDKGERSNRGSGGLPAKWYPTADGKFLWKGDTSSDEVNGHYYGVSLYHDLVAKGKEKVRAAEHLARISKHLLDHGWVLEDMDGKPTRWGRWDPDYLLKPYGSDARGLNGMEAQTYMTTSLAQTGRPEFAEGLKQTVKWRYHTYTVRQRVTFPPDLPAPWDDELAFRCYVPLLTYATDPELKAIYRRSLDRTWEILRVQRQPIFNFHYGGLTGNDCDEQEAAATLRETPLDVRSYSYRNSHRLDLAPGKEHTSFGGATRGLSPREGSPELGAGSALSLDGGSGGRGAFPPTGWLEGYWLGRYYGMLQAPTTRDRAATTLAPRDPSLRAAAPYSGPERPKERG